MSEWKEVTLDNIADVRDGTHDSPKQQDEGEYLITSRHIKNGKIDFSSAYKISIIDYNEVNRRSKVDKWDVLFSMIGTIGEMTIVDFEPKFAIKNIGLFKTNGNSELAKWIYYYFKSDEAKAEINASLKGSTQQYITLGDLRRFPFILPPLPEQKAIAGVLSSLDDKIDLLHRQNKTLEAMAEALFLQWFVEEASDDWEVITIDDIAYVSTGKGLKKEEYLEYGKYPVLGANGVIGRTDKYLFSKDDNIMITGRVGTHGKVFLINKMVWVSDNALIIKPKEHHFRYVLYFILKGLDYASLNVGSTQPLITQTDIKKVELQTVDGLFESFDKIVLPLFENIEENINQIYSLEKLRDTLLPKLMSGEVRVME